MPDEQKKRIRRTAQELADAVDVQVEKLEESICTLEDKKDAAIAEYDRKIDSVRAKIDALQQRKENLLNPKTNRKPRRTKKRKIESILKQAQKAGMKPEEIADMLGIQIEE